MSSKKKGSFNRALLRQLKENGFFDMTGRLPAKLPGLITYSAGKVAVSEKSCPYLIIDDYVMEAVQNGISSKNQTDRAYWHREFKRRAWKQGRYGLLSPRDMLLWPLHFGEGAPVFGQPYQYDRENPQSMPIYNMVAPHTKPYQAEVKEEKINPLADFALHMPEYKLNGNKLISMN